MHVAAPPRRLVGALARHVGGRVRLHVVVVLACALGLDSADTASIGASETQLEHGLHLTTSDVGVVLGVSSAVAALLTLPAGVLVDRRNRTRLLAIAAAAWGVAALGSAAASGMAALLTAQVALGAATALAGPAVASLVGDFFPVHERGRVYGWVLTGELVGAGLGLVLAGGLASVSWRLSFAVLALPSVGVVWLLHRLPEPARGGASRLAAGSDRFVDAAEPYPEHRSVGSPATDGQPAAAQPTDEALSLWGAVRYVLSVRTNLVIIVVSSLGYFFFAGVRGFAMALIKEQYGVGQGLATVLVPLIGLGALVGVLVGGRLGDRRFRGGVPTARIRVAGVAMLLACGFLAPALLATSLAVAVPLLVVGAACVGGQNPPMDAARLDVVRARVWGRAEGVRMLFKSGAQAVSPVAFGLLADHAFGGGGGGLRDAFLVLLAPLVVGGVVMLTFGWRCYPADARRAQRAHRGGGPAVPRPRGAPVGP